VAQVYNPNYLEDWGQENWSLKPGYTKSS
jgi:hypothetical protein